MKKLVFIALGLFAFSSLKAQSGNYWTTESNTFSKDYTIVRFYDEADNLLYSEKLEGKYVDLSKRKNIRKLNRALEKYSEQHGKGTPTNSELVAGSF